jgi:hypothetical protein
LYSVVVALAVLVVVVIVIDNLKLVDAVELVDGFVVNYFRFISSPGPLLWLVCIK